MRTIYPDKKWHDVTIDYFKENTYIIEKTQKRGVSRMKKEKIIKLFITLLISTLIVSSVLFYQNSSHENELDKFSYKKYLHELGFSKTENPTEEEIQNYDRYIHLYSQAANKEDEGKVEEAEQLYLESTKYSVKGYIDLEIST